MSTARSDTAILFSARTTRLFAYGFVSVVLVLYLAETGLSPLGIGTLLSATLAGDIVVSLWITMIADRMGRKKMLLLGSLLMILGGVVFVLTQNPVLLTLAAIIGIISPSGNEIGPFLSIEQAALAQLVSDQKRTALFGWYNLAGSFATAAGALAGGWLATLLQDFGLSAFASYRSIMAGYACCGAILLLLFSRLSQDSELPRQVSPEVQAPTRFNFGIARSKNIVLKLSGLFAVDAFAGGFVVQSMVAWWFHVQYGIDEGLLGTMFFGANLLAGVSALAATKIAGRIGLVNTMVFSHIPSNILLCLVPLMPNLWLAITVLLLRASISQMDVPARQSYTMAVVDPEERTAASGITHVARSVGAASSPVLAGLLMANPLLFSAPFFIAGGLKIVYDLYLYKLFKNVQTSH
ncbi:MFS transporter [Desulfopila sp. IMCC35006]|uniref:MFS transporter n=1 Tax=Desulfopila sp. IMCC35006 TaxID=2569542 RepID=UPI0010ACE1A6|nr:MFS transporter [Desulfopila sp. IMCC35006]TKB23917.1 MFS transporter [Desulfopila sp. IMCC35006]